ncbi:hypothetical protein OQA88_13133 [Cercophora sp. LCS_1]
MSLLQSFRLAARPTLRAFSTTTPFRSSQPSDQNPPSRFDNFLKERVSQSQSQSPNQPPRPAPLESIFDLPARIESDANAMASAGYGMFDHSEFMQKHSYGAAKEPLIRLRPPTGRTVNVTSTVNPARALAMLSRLTGKNKIAKEAMMQKFHERPALRRKRQWRERKEHRFAQGVRAAIYRTMTLKKQGW